MPDLTRIGLIAKREWLTRLRQRSFQITTIVQVLFVVIGGRLPAMVARFSDDSVSTSTILVLDEATPDRRANDAVTSPPMGKMTWATAIDRIALEDSDATPTRRGKRSTTVTWTGR